MISPSNTSSDAGLHTYDRNTSNSFSSGRGVKLRKTVWEKNTYDNSLSLWRQNNILTATTTESDYFKALSKRFS